MKRLEVKISDEEAQVLEQYCKQSEKTKTDVIRSYIRQLKRKAKKRCIKLCDACTHRIGVLVPIAFGYKRPWRGFPPFEGKPHSRTSLAQGSGQTPRRR